MSTNAGQNLVPVFDSDINALSCRPSIIPLLQSCKVIKEMVVSELYKEVNVGYSKAALEGFLKADPSSYRYIETLSLRITPIWIPLIDQLGPRLERAAKAVLGSKASSEQVQTYIKDNYRPATCIHLDADRTPCSLLIHAI